MCCPVCRIAACCLSLAITASVSAYTLCQDSFDSIYLTNSINGRVPDSGWDRWLATSGMARNGSGHAVVNGYQSAVLPFIVMPTAISISTIAILSHTPTIQPMPIRIQRLDIGPTDIGQHTSTQSHFTICRPLPCRNRVQFR